MKNFLYLCALKRFWNKTTIAAMYQEEKLVQDVSVIAQRLKELHNDAVIAYTPQVQELCAKKATENEVGWMLDLLWSFAGDERILKLYKQVCRAYWKIYPKTIAYYIMAYRKEYDRESLIGTEYEYLLHEDERFGTRVYQIEKCNAHCTNEYSKHCLEN